MGYFFRTHSSSSPHTSRLTSFYAERLHPLVFANDDLFHRKAIVMHLRELGVGMAQHKELAYDEVVGNIKDLPRFRESFFALQHDEPPRLIIAS